LELSLISRGATTGASFIGIDSLQCFDPSYRFQVRVNKMSQLPCDIFRETLAIMYPHCGHALWDPSPEGLYDAVAVGDVGFIREGYFHRLFNVLLPENHPSHLNSGVPENHQPLRPSLSNHIRKSTDGTDDFCSRYVTLSRGPDIHALG